METMNFENIIGAVNGDEAHVLGKFLYFSLSHLLVEKDELAALCDSLHIPHSVGSRVSVSDAFRSATGDIRDRLVSQQSGEAKIYAIYCRDNERTPDMYSRELVKETLNERTNQYQKLANIHYDRTDGSFGYANLSFDADVDALKYCQQAEELFEPYQRCANRRQIETICVGYLRSLEAFIEGLVPLNRAKTPLTVNSFYIVDDAKQRRRDGALGRQNPQSRGQEAPLRRHSPPRVGRAGRRVRDAPLSTEKIGGVVAALIELDRAIRYGNDTRESAYDSP